MENKRILIIGAGPIGIEAGLYALKLGYNVTIFEKGIIGENIKKWSHVTFFSPFNLNSSKIGLEYIDKTNLNFFEEKPFCKGLEYLENYLLPISKTLKNNIKENTKVLSISRKNTLKGELIGKEQRGNIPFIVHAKSDSEEFYFETDIIIDASGTYDNPVNFGIGGLKVLNQEKVKEFITQYIPDIKSKDKEKYIGKSTLLIGNGYSAATCISYFIELFKENTDTKLFWMVKDNKDKPYDLIENDPLPLRYELSENANLISKNPNNQFEFIPNSYIRKFDLIKENNLSKVKVTIESENKENTLIVDNIISNVGYKPDNSIYQELQIHECYASQGPMKLAAKLLSSSSQDCLTQTSQGSDTLKNPEPNFYIIGNKSYGRNSTFLIKLGYDQIVDIFSLISENSELNLYK